ncbi:MAG: hypothetical protein L3J14_08975 [Flavobacteriaceae bacterium]|nr:hypothetical protein [Flavobacteriaceae bacterium]
MKKTVILLITIAFVLIGCKKSMTDKQSKEVSIEGVWVRSFEMGSGVSANVTYTIGEGSIHYDMKGPRHVQYTIKKDTVIAKDNKWIGNVDGKQYVIFTKNVSEKEMTLLKIKVKDKKDALEKAFPSDTARSKFSSWNVYLKK